MSDTTMPASKAALTNAAVKAAQDLPDLVAKLEMVAPDVAQQLRGKSAAASSTLWGHMTILAIGAIVAKFGVNWDSAFQVELAGALVIGAQAAWGIASRLWTGSPISGLLHPAPVAAAPPAAASANAAKLGAAVALLLALPALAACSAAQLATAASAIGLSAQAVTAAQTVVAYGQLFCAQATVSGPVVSAIVDAAGVPVTVTNKAASWVAAVCGLIGGTPVSPPAMPAAAPVKAVNVAAVAPA